MPSFDVVSEIDMQEVDNAVNSVKRELKQRYDFKGSNSSVERSENEITILADDDVQCRALQEMLKVHFTRRKIDPKALEFKESEAASQGQIRQKIIIKEGIEQDIAKKITKHVKSSKLKVQAAIRGEELRITGKKRDDLQEAIADLKAMDLPIPLQYINFRD